MKFFVAFTAAIILIAFPHGLIAGPAPPCDFDQISTDLENTSPPGDEVCPLSFTRVVTMDIQGLLMMLGQRRLDLEARYLCGDHCGIRFYGAVNRVCPEIRDEFLALLCSQNFPSPTDDPTYCVYAELYFTAIMNVTETCSEYNQHGNCSGECRDFLTEALGRLGCCINTRYNSSIGFLRDTHDYIPSLLLSSSGLYAACGVEGPGVCDPPYDMNGAPVYTDNPPETTTMMSGGSAVAKAQLDAAILAFEVSAALLSCL